MMGENEVDDPDAEAGSAADGSAAVSCPYCGEPNDVVLDPGGGAVQEYVEDCQVCCQPWHVHVRWRRDGRADVRVERGDE
jgi:hypothetical protein